MTRDEARAWVSQFNDEALLADGFEGAIIGCAEGAMRDHLVVYDYQRCIEILMERDGMDYEDAVECFDFNVLGAWMGEGTPLFLHRVPGG